MSWTGEHDGHDEGFVSYLTADGRTHSASNGFGILIRRLDADQRTAAAWAANRTPTDEDIDELVPYAEVAGWEVGCTCGWTGRQWTRSEARLDDNPYLDPESAYLSDGRTVEDHAYEQWSAHVEPAGRLAAVERAAAALAEARQSLDEAVRQARRVEPAASWAAIGQAAGVTRQSAHERWGGALSR